MSKLRLPGLRILPSRAQRVAEKEFHPCWSGPGGWLPTEHLLNCNFHCYLKPDFGVLEFCFLQEVFTVFFPPCCFSYETRAVDYPTGEGGGTTVSEVSGGGARQGFQDPEGTAFSLRRNSGVERLARNAWVQTGALPLTSSVVTLGQRNVTRPLSASDKGTPTYLTGLVGGELS